MRILIVSTFFPPLNSIASLRPYSWAKYWTLEGHDVTVLTTAKNPASSLRLDLPNPGYRVIEAPLPPLLDQLKNPGAKNETQKPPSLKALLRKPFEKIRHRTGIFNACRMPDFTHLWVKKALQAVEKEDCWDLIISSAGPYPVHIVGERLKKQGKGKVWFADYRDTWSNNYIYPGLFPFNWLERKLEKKLLRSADAAVSISDPFAEILSRTFQLPAVHTVENGFDPEDLEKIDPTPYFPAPDKFRIVHTGSIYLKNRNPAPLFEAIQQMAQNKEERKLLSNLEVIFAGQHQANLLEMIEQYKVSPWVTFTGFVSREDALRMQRDAHALLFLPWRDETVDGVLTGKLFEYLYAKTPIISVGRATPEAAQNLIGEAGAGESLPDVQAIRKFLARHLAKPIKRTVEPDPTVLLRYTRKTQALKLLQLAQQEVA